jgi:hypothetical protein
MRTHEAESREVLARRTGTDATVARRSALYNWVAYPSADQLDQIQDAWTCCTRRRRSTHK